MVFSADWVILQYKGGDKYHSHCGQEEKQSSIMITCDPDVDDVSFPFMFYYAFGPFHRQFPEFFLHLHVCEDYLLF